MSTHNICFHGEIRKILCGYSLLSVAMKFTHHHWTILREFAVGIYLNFTKGQTLKGNVFPVMLKPGLRGDGNVKTTFADRNILF